MRISKGRGILLLCIFLMVSIYPLTKLFPEQTARLILSGLRLSAGLSTKTVETNAGTIHYLKGGKGQTVVFMHGIYARKEHWIDLTRALSDQYEVILFDLPGFGENPVMDVGEYSYDKQKQHFQHLLSVLNIKRFHLAANSMGAQIASMIAKDYPDRVISLAFIGSPVGVTSPERSDMEKALTVGLNPLLVKTIKDFQDRLKWLFPNIPYIPEPVIKTWAIKEARMAKDNERIWQEVSQSAAPRMEKITPEITQPTLILWCREDRIFHISGADTLLALLPNAKLVRMNGCGHVPMLDKPKATGAAYRSFLDGLNRNTPGNLKDTGSAAARKNKSL